MKAYSRIKFYTRIGVLLCVVLCILTVVVIYNETNPVKVEKSGVIAYHFYKGGLTAIGLKGCITTIMSPPTAYGFEIDGHAVQTNKTTWYTSVDGQKIGYVEIKSCKSVEYSTSSVK